MTGLFNDPIIETPLAPARPNSTGDLTSQFNSFLNTLPGGASGQDVTAQFNAYLAKIQGGAQSFSNTMQNAANGLNTGLQTAAQKITVGSVFGAPFTLDSGFVYRIVAVIGGLILIAGAVWGFDNIRDTGASVVKTGVKAVKTGAEIAAA